MLWSLILPRASFACALLLFWPETSLTLYPPIHCGFVNWGLAIKYWAGQSATDDGDRAVCL